jgi:cbb3-type cytochrome oxidase subunit 3
MPPSKRPATYILMLLLALLLVLVAWMFHALSSPELQQAARAKAAIKLKQR